MSSLIEGAASQGANNLVARGTEIGNRVKGLELVIGAARGRLDETVLGPAAEVVSKAGERLRLSADHTVVALGGATGSGKSSTFNALIGLDLASVSVRRPTTSWVTACTWGAHGATELLTWLGVPPRHQILRDSMLDTGREGKELDGLVLLDMPDHDSTELSNHLEVDRLVRLADLLIWVLDPQKYADAAIHDRFLRPLAAHKGVMMVVLNHIDEVAPDRRAGMMADLRRLLDADGLEGITLIATSAREGIGVDELRTAIASRVADKAATRQRISTNVSEVAGALAQASGNAAPPVLTEQDSADLRAELATAAGVDVVVDAVERAGAARARRATGWPPVSWVSRLRKDPLSGLDLPGSEVRTRTQAGMPDPNQLQSGRVDAAVRRLADRLSEPLSRPWASAVSRAATAHLAEVSERLDQAVSSSAPGPLRTPAWAQGVRVLQWLLLLAAVAGGAWLLAAEAGGGGVDLPEVAVLGVRAELLLLVGGLVAGLLLALLCRAAAGRGARARAQEVDQALRATVDRVADELVLTPITRELDAYRATTEGLRAALA